MSLAVQSHLCGAASPTTRVVGGQGLGRRQGKHNPILPGWLTDSNCTQAGGRAQAGTRGPRGCSRGKEAVAGGLSPEVHSQVSVSTPTPCFPNTSPLPRILKLEMRNPLVWGLCNNHESLFFFPKNSSLHSRGGIYHPMPRMQTCPCFRSTCQCKRHKRQGFDSLGWEEPLEKEMATHSSILAWKIP